LHVQPQIKGVENIKIPEKKLLKNLEESKDSSNIHESDDDDEENINVLINSLKNFVDPKEGGSKEEDENFAEDDKDRVFAK
jgi:hypothetical protein